MSSFVRRNILRTFRNFGTSSGRPYKIPTTYEHATGVEKAELVAKAEGNEDPWDFELKKRGPGTLQNPNLIPSAFQARLVGCYCHPDDLHANWMWLHMGVPKRCECGYWFKLVEKEPFHGHGHGQGHGPDPCR